MGSARCGHVAFVSLAGLPKHPRCFGVECLRECLLVGCPRQGQGQCRLGSAASCKAMAGRGSQMVCWEWGMKLLFHCCTPLRPCGHAAPTHVQKHEQTILRALAATPAAPRAWMSECRQRSQAGVLLYLFERQSSRERPSSSSDWSTHQMAAMARCV